MRCRRGDAVRWGRIDWTKGRKREGGREPRSFSPWSRESGPTELWMFSNHNLLLSRIDGPESIIAAIPGDYGMGLEETANLRGYKVIESSWDAVVGFLLDRDPTGCQSLPVSSLQDLAIVIFLDQFFESTQPSMIEEQYLAPIPSATSGLFAVEYTAEHRSTISAVTTTFIRTPRSKRSPSYDTPTRDLDSRRPRIHSTYGVSSVAGKDL
jgi:hypothetical protein